MLKISDIPKDRLLEFLKPGVKLFIIQNPESSYTISRISNSIIYHTPNEIFGSIKETSWFPYFGIKIEIEGFEI